MTKNVTKLWNREFDIIKNGLSEDQVVAFVNELVSEQDTLISRQENLSSLTKLAERTVTEAEKLAEEIKREAADQAKAEVSKIIADAEGQAEQIFEGKRTEIMTKATEQAEAVKANAEREAELIRDRQRERIQPELKKMAQRVYNQLLSELESLKEQVVAMEEEFEPKLFPPTEQTDEVLASISQENNLTPVTSSEASTEPVPDTLDEFQQLMENVPDSAHTKEKPNQVPTTWEEKVEIEFLPPANILQILEIDKHLEALPEVEATEIIPITDRPIIEVFLREPMQLIDALSALPGVSQIKEDTDGESTTTSEAEQAEGKSRKIQITLSESTNADKAKG